MKKNSFRLTVCAMLYAVCSSVEAQQPGKVPRIGILSNTTTASAANILESFKLGLREFEYVDGKNILLEYRYAEGKLERLITFAMCGAVAQAQQPQKVPRIG